MKIVTEIDLADFKAWSGAKSTLKELVDRGDDRKVESLIEDALGEYIDETSLNDFLWFENDTIADWLGYSSWEAYEKGEEEDE